jgi:hypothetical protein
MSQEAPTPPPPASEEKQLCISCLAPNEPLDHFCAKCGAPLSSYASTGFLESAFAEGAVYRAAAERPRILIVVLGIWLIFGMAALSGAVMVVVGINQGFMYSIIGAAILAFSVVMIVKTTKNYFAKAQPVERRDG